jgi:hypothetical protein
LEDSKIGAFTSKCTFDPSMKRFWVIINTAVVIYFLYVGYYTRTAAHSARHPAPGLSPGFFFLVAMIIYCDGMVRKATSGLLKKPSWNRNPLRMRRDPLQTIFMLHMVFVALTIGMAAHFYYGLRVEFSTFFTGLCLVLGLLLGQLWIYNRYRSRIVM